MSRVAGRTAADFMVTLVKTLPCDASVADVLEEFADDHVHLVVLVRAGVLRGTVLRGDLSAGLAPDSTATRVATTVDRTVGPRDDIADVHRTMIERGLRRLAVVDEKHRLLGLVCLKRDGTGFCSDRGVTDRRRARDAGSDGLELVGPTTVGPTTVVRTTGALSTARER